MQYFIVTNSHNSLRTNSEMAMKTQLRKRVTFSWMLLIILAAKLPAQVAPQAEPVYGGYIEWTDVIATGADESRVFVATASANSMFYADVSNLSTTPVVTPFQTIPDLDADDSYGAIRCYAVEENSGFVFAGLGSGALVATNTSAASIYTVTNHFVEAVEAFDSFLFYLVQMGPGAYMFFTSVDVSGNVGTIDSVLVASSSGWDMTFRLQIIISPYDNYVYVFVPGEPPFMYKSSDTYDSFSTSTTFSVISTSDLTATGYEYFAAAVAPDGRIFAASYGGHSDTFESRISYSDADGDPWTTAIHPDDMGRGAMKISGDSASYRVYCSRIMSDDKGLSWSQHGGADGAIAPDPLNPDIAYVRTDWAMGLFNHATSTVDEINDGLLAVEVNDFSMDATKNIAWVATKSGIWYVSDYLGTPIWSDPIWPQGESVPWERALCSTTGDTALLGNTNGNLFRYESASGLPEDQSSYERLFDSRDDSVFPLWNWTYGTRLSAVAVDPASTSERIFLGLYDAEDFDEPADSLGGIFVGTKSGSTWSWEHITGSPIPNTGCDVNDIVVVEESGNTVAYVGVERNTTYGTVNGVFRIEESGSAWNISNDLFLNASYPISATIIDLYVTESDTIFACGTDASGTTVRIYKKAIGDTYWISITSSGLVAPNTARAITYDETNHDLYIAVDNIIYVLMAGASSWQVYWEYPAATDINVLYFDDLMVGTGTGLYNHAHGTSSVSDHSPSGVPSEIELMQNFPNPFNPGTVIKYRIPARTHVTLTVYDIMGHKVATLINEEQEAGAFAVTFSAAQTHSLASGVYIYKLKAGGFTKSRKLLLLK